jgi:tRNA threonylcarbamoyladenosine biosynthesis protein TsaB
MFRHLEFLLGELSLKLEQFDLYAVAAGPGSFTGLRVGLAAAKGWAEVYGKPIAAVSALEAVAAQAHSTADLLVPVLDARRGEIYFGFYRRAKSGGLALDGEECSGAPAEFVELLRERAGGPSLAIVTPVGEIVEAAMSRNETLLVPIENVGMVLAPMIGQIGLERARRGDTVDALHLDANYVRRTDAELKWKRPERA